MRFISEGTAGVASSGLKYTLLSPIGLARVMDNLGLARRKGQTCLRTENGAMRRRRARAHKSTVHAPPRSPPAPTRRRRQGAWLMKYYPTRNERKVITWGAVGTCHPRTC
jgi:hypothetical protein